MSFQNLEISSNYDSGFGDLDVIAKFYNPILENSIRYDRVAGYFSSSVFASSARGIAGLVRNGGKMRLLTSHAFTESDTRSFQDYFDSEEFANSLIEAFTKSYQDLGSLASTIAKSHVGAMCWMLSKGFLEIKVVIPNSADLNTLGSDDWEKFHPKFGIFYDSAENIVAFSGSVNETAGAWKRNIENFDVFTSWSPGEMERRIDPKINQFEKMWNGELSGPWKTISLPSAVRDKIIQEYAPSSFPEELTQNRDKSSRKLRNYQTDAVNAWINADCSGILEMATGTGKTRTAKACIEYAITKGSLLTLVVVPYQHIGQQWLRELKEFNPLMVTGNWKKILWEASLEATLGRISRLTLVVVKNTASKDTFIDYINEIRENFDHFLFVGDEVHWLGAKTFQTSLISAADLRLGLSATPKRYFDETGTQVLKDYFGETVYELSIKKALEIRDEAGNQILCPYEYHPIIVGLNESESEKYREFSLKIARMSGLESTPEIAAQRELLLIMRAAVAKSAESKIPALRELLAKMKKPITQTLVYCADFDQLKKAASVLNEYGLNVQQITGDESATASQKFNDISEREHIISNFALGHLDVLLAIDCLDEGVDIPSAEIGIILASSGNEKEFIQRRGRLMRPFMGKERAVIHDFCVLPEDSEDPLNSLNLVQVELRRISTFGEDSLNFEEVQELLSEKGMDQGYE